MFCVCLRLLLSLRIQKRRKKKLSTNKTVYLQLLYKSQYFATKLKLAVMTGEENEGPADIDRNKTQD